MKTPKLKSWTVILIPGAIVVFLFVGLALSSRPGSRDEEVLSSRILNACIEHTNVLLHAHADLTILLNGIKQTIPTDIGIEENGCMHPLHTHDTSGKIHMEYLYPVDFTLGDFFAVWGESFSKSELMGLAVDETHVISMTVNGQPSEAFENYMLQDDDEVVISYEERSTE